VSIHGSILGSMTSARAKLFQNGGSQAVRLPKDCRFPEDQTEVVVRRKGRRVILEPADVWPSSFVRCLGAWRESIERPRQVALADLEDPLR
jgi:antitoxin VapB